MEELKDSEGHLASRCIYNGVFSCSKILDVFDNRMFALDDDALRRRESQTPRTDAAFSSGTFYSYLGHGSRLYTTVQNPLKSSVFVI